MRQKTILVAAVVLSALASPALVGCSAATTETLTVQSRYLEREVIEVVGGGGSSLGDMVAGHGELLDESGAIVGSFEAMSTTTRVGSEDDGRFLQAEYAFGDTGADAILLMGVETFTRDGGFPEVGRPLLWAIVGGTGKYQGARGQCDTQRNEQDVFINTCTFSTVG
ncbi:MAG: hypothetical protein RJB01_1403 [Actinomycetota bacterium]|jgi:hypothetical protein